MYTKSKFICFIWTEVCSLALKEGYALRVYENTVPTGILYWSLEMDEAV